jgi:hypothetical protein
MMTTYTPVFPPVTRNTFPLRSGKAFEENLDAGIICIVLSWIRA